MTNREKRKLSRRIERGLNQLYKAHQRELREAKKYLRRAKKIQELRKLLVAAKNQLWEE